MPPLTLKISVFEYTDYRKYLFDYYTEQKRTSKAFSYRYFARKIGVNSVGLYKDVVEGRQSLGRSLILKFSIALSHGKKEAEYFENMVFFCEAKTVEERKLYFNRMMSFYESKAFKINAKQYEYYSKWYYSAIRALLSYYSFKDDYKGLAKALVPAIRPDQARRSIQTLEKLQLIKLDEHGFYRPVDAIVTTGQISDDGKLQSLNIVNFQKAMMQKAGEAFDLHPWKKLDMSTLTLSFSGETYKAVKEEIAAFRKKLLRMAENDSKPDRIYQINYQVFPFTRIKEDA